MPRCEITGIMQMATMKCLHPKYEGKQAGYITCKHGMKKVNGVYICAGRCPNFIEGTGTHNVWCKLWKEKMENERANEG